MRDLRLALREIYRKDGRFQPEAYEFLYESLEPSIRLAGRSEAQGSDRHITGQELLRGLFAEGKRLFGPVGAHVWRTWGIEEPMDWGRVVFLLVEGGLLNRRDSDSIEDFNESIDFDEYFVAGYEIELPAEIGPTHGG
ncbi:MAG: putative repeat protein (TIGR04138 family) [Candidatus Paceibacteria bacterium]|jgi:uncharacterized repeat protein (TIGR04138 family)